jgi:hypothetical protein
VRNSWLWLVLNGLDARTAPKIVRFSGVKLRKRHKIVVLFWIPFCSLAVGVFGLVGWAVSSIHL